MSEKLTPSRDFWRARPARVLTGERIFAVFDELEGGFELEAGVEEFTEFVGEEDDLGLAEADGFAGGARGFFRAGRSGNGGAFVAQDEAEGL